MQHKKTLSRKVLNLCCIVAFWVMTPCSFVGGYQHFGGMHCLRIQDLEDGISIFLRDFGNTYQAIQCHNSKGHSVNPRATCYERYDNFFFASEHSRGRVGRSFRQVGPTCKAHAQSAVELSRELSVFSARRG